MIHLVLPVILKELNGFLRKRMNLAEGEGEDPVILSELMNLDGTLGFEGNNKVVCSLINVEQERMNLNKRGNSMVHTYPPVNLNLFVLISVYFPTGTTRYYEALQFLSWVIGFFQGKQVFTPKNTPGLPGKLERITTEIVNLDMRELSNFWTAVGSKHLPSVIYKMRMVSITEEMILEEIPVITGLET